MLRTSQAYQASISSLMLAQIKDLYFNHLSAPPFVITRLLLLARSSILFLLFLAFLPLLFNGGQLLQAFRVLSFAQLLLCPLLSSLIALSCLLLPLFLCFLSCMPRTFTQDLAYIMKTPSALLANIWANGCWMTVIKYAAFPMIKYTEFPVKKGSTLFKSSVQYIH